MDCRFNKLDIIERISIISSYADRIKECNYDALEFIEKEIIYTHKLLTFFDPPYYNKGPILFTNFYKHKDHVELAKAIKTKMLTFFICLSKLFE